MAGCGAVCAVSEAALLATSGAGWAAWPETSGAITGCCIAVWPAGADCSAAGAVSGVTVIGAFTASSVAAAGGIAVFAAVAALLSALFAAFTVLLLRLGGVVMSVGAGVALVSGAGAADDAVAA